MTNLGPQTKDDIEIIIDARDQVVARVTAWNPDDIVCDVRVGRHRFSTDDPSLPGGSDAGPSATELVLSGLATEAAQQVRVAAKEGGWDPGDVYVHCRLVRDTGGVHRIERDIRMQRQLLPEQRQTVLSIAVTVPLADVLGASIEIATTVW